MNVFTIDTAKIQILIIDRERTTEQNLRNYCQSSSDLEISGYAANSVRALQQIKVMQPNVALIDLDLPNLDGFTAIKILREQASTTKILVYSNRNEREYISLAIEAGAKGYLLKTTPLQDLVNAIRYVHQGYFQLGPGLLETLIFDATRSSLLGQSPLLESKFNSYFDRYQQELQSQWQDRLDTAIDRRQLYVDEKIELKLHSLKLKQASVDIELKKLKKKLVKLFWSQAVVITIAVILLSIR
jgi:DNA-binding NarL/FixJ family response regulator